MPTGFVLRLMFRIVAVFSVWNGDRVKRVSILKLVISLVLLLFLSGSQKKILSLVRNHWSIENGLHFVKDRWRDEDRHYLAMPGLGERFTCLLNRAVSVLGLLRRGKEPLTAVAAFVRDKPKKCLKRLGLIN